MASSPQSTEASPESGAEIEPASAPTDIPAVSTSAVSTGKRSRSTATATERSPASDPTWYSVAPAARPGCSVPFTVTAFTRQPSAAAHATRAASPSATGPLASAVPATGVPAPTATHPPAAGETVALTVWKICSKTTSTRWSAESPSNCTKPAAAAASSRAPSTVTEATRQPTAGANDTRALLPHCSDRAGVIDPEPSARVSMENTCGSKATWSW